MGILEDQKIDCVHHYAPLHYLPFIARSKALMSKPSLEVAGFAKTHLRSMSHAQDVERGFGAYSHLTIEPSPRILKAKLDAGFPHVGIAVPTSSIEAVEFSLCRFNVAMTRFLRRDGKPGFPESSTNGRYYDGHQIPIARTDEDKSAMLAKHLPAGTMIEVLVHGDLDLPKETEVLCFSPENKVLVESVLGQLRNIWNVKLLKPPGPYPRNHAHVENVTAFVQRAVAEPDWRGNGLEFDRL